MTLEEAIQLTKQALEKVNPDKRVSTEFRFTVGQVKQMLEWLEDYKQLKADYIELDNRLRTANTEIDRLKSVSSWISCGEMMPEDNVDVLVYDDGILIARYNADEKYTSGWMESFECYPLTNVTHWMPLPEPPERKDDTHDND